MLSTGEVWNPTDLASVETSDKDKIKYTKNNFCGSLKQLLSLVLTSDDLINLINQNIKIAYLRTVFQKILNRYIISISF